MKKSLRFLVWIFFNLICLIHSQKTISQKCDTCNNLVKKFIEGLQKTAKGNFGGGNTDWEDRKLGSYLTSETRFEEIVEKLCTPKDYECHKIIENKEDYLLDIFQNNPNELKSLLDGFCINELKLCCSKESYGPHCTSCKKNWNKICSNNGNCDGSGTRSGSGKCKCNIGYIGELCDQCSESYFPKTKSDSFILCQKCPNSCKTCVEENTCLSCMPGYTLNIESKNCDDLDECKEDPEACGDKECINKPGSFECRGEDQFNEESKSDDEYKKKLILIKRAIIIGVTIITGFSAYFARQYLMTILSVSFGCFLFYVSS